jgi:hypothetical protein
MTTTRDVERTEECAWNQDGDEEGDTYGTGCGNYFVINEGTPADNDMKFCCYCGKPIRQSLIEVSNDD